ncbi:hypothetical protein Barb4_00722 [Bacteroidales bacterium Barb4]|nr:hypothetical protein Barb4_00722 [Bacteroidales bacterium Barb4]
MISLCVSDSNLSSISSKVCMTVAHTLTHSLHSATADTERVNATVSRSMILSSISFTVLAVSLHFH